MPWFPGRRQDAIGFRPEGLGIVSEDTENTIPIEVEFVEELGSDAYIYGHLAGADLGHGLPGQRRKGASAFLRA